MLEAENASTVFNLQRTLPAFLLLQLDRSGVSDIKKGGERTEKGR